MSDSIHPSSRLISSTPATNELPRLDRIGRPQQPTPIRDADDIVSRPRPQVERVGFQTILETGLGNVSLPSAPDLISALESARSYADSADKAVPGLGRLVDAVLEDECRKLSRYLDMQTT
ncbi:hypothetical protein JJJ17_00195 [Paracoccus caeni]|uniref:Uncharacterized protein n=1 Tax=Paracoccus caeni TaxID=657651 RepID=A0A934VYZ3_9RHOB|nr:hypothetical protein [Paracoccus caeni]MBK4214334.1 hypothetical protein [Paracoccus caeni]